MKLSLALGGFCAIAAFGLARPGQAWAYGCPGGSSLYGPYSILVAGHPPANGGGKFLSGVIDFDGQCHVTGGDVNGGINGAVSNNSVTGAYALNPDNTVSLTLNLSGQGQPQTYIVGISRTSAGAAGIETDGTAIATVSLQAQLWGFGYNQRILQGAFAVSCNGEPGGYSDLNYVTFDGQGHLSGTDVYNNGGNQGDLPYTGQYTVNPDGTFTATLNGSFSIYQLTGVIDLVTTEIKYTYTLTGAGEIVACTGRK